MGLYSNASVRHQVVEKAISQSDNSPIHAMAKCYIELYGNSVHVGEAAGSNFAFKTAAKLLQIEAWLGLLLTAYRNSSSPYPTVDLPSLTL